MNTTTKDATNLSQTTGRGETLTDLEKIVAAHPFLEGLNPHQRRLLMDCSLHINFKSGELIFREGDPANRFYLILRGKVSLESYVRDAGVMPIQTVGAGEVLGWSWLFPPFFWHFDARAIEPTEAIFFYGIPLREQCEIDHDLGYALVKRMAEVMMKRLQSTRRKLLNLFPPDEMA
jgi:CRP/FNR family transcriptional regulator, cyclic AMP receptor protein